MSVHLSQRFTLYLWIQISICNTSISEPWLILQQNSKPGEFSAVVIRSIHHSIVDTLPEFLSAIWWRREKRKVSHSCRDLLALYCDEEAEEEEKGRFTLVWWGVSVPAGGVWLCIRVAWTMNQPTYPPTISQHTKMPRCVCMCVPRRITQALNQTGQLEAFLIFPTFRSEATLHIICPSDRYFGLGLHRFIP